MMPTTIFMYSRLTFVFLVLSFILWILSSYSNTMCETERVNAAKVSHPDPPESINTPPYESTIPRDHESAKSSCFPLKYTALNQTGVAAITVLGAINLNNTAIAGISAEKLFPKQFANLVDKDSSNIVLSNLVSPIQSETKTVKMWLKTARSYGLSLLSLANQHIQGDGKSATTASDAAGVCEDTSIRWVGLNAKSHEIVKVNGVKLGILAFCGLYAACMETTSQPFTPTKYTTKAATSAVQELQEHNVDSIIVILYWGREYSYFPDETALYAARHLAELGVDVVVGYHPHLLQDHAYFGNTLVVFSPGYFISPDQLPHFCWERSSVSSSDWTYKSSEHCQMIHPSLRQSMLERELQTRVYKIFISVHRPGPAVSAKHVTLSLETDQATGFRIIALPEQNLEDNSDILHWTTLCGEEDPHCLSCKPF